MSKPKLSLDYDDPSDINPSIESISINAFDDVILGVETPHGISEHQYHIVVKRNGGLYKTLNILNTVFSILAVLLIVVVFVMVFYSLITITEVAEVVENIKEHNELASPTPEK